MANQTALVFGHSSGLGLELSRVLLNDGFRVIGISRRISEIEDDNLINLECDLSSPEQIEEVVAVIKSEFAKFDVLIFAAGTLTAHNIDYLDYKELERIFRVNTFAPMTVESGLLDLIRENGADIINVTSSALIDYYPAFAEYSATKAAFAKFTFDLEKELFDTPCRVMDLCPSGFTSNIYKDMTGDIIDRDESKQMKSSDLAAFVLAMIKLPKIMEVAKVFIQRKK